MTEGATEPVEQAVAPAAAPTGEPERMTWWDRIKPLWWVRGIVGALGLIALLDQLGWVREDWLKLVHVIATRWDQVVSILVGYVTAILPWGMEVTSAEAHFLTVVFALTVPATIPSALILLRPPRRRWHEVLLAFLFVLLLNNVVFALMPGESWLIGGYGDVYSIVLLLTTVTTLLLLYRVNRPYFRALTTTVLFFATLEVIYLAPAAQAFLAPVVDWIDPGGAAPSSLP
jgi:hypothetical protein